MITIYTDGACSNNGSSDAVAGWSYCVVRGDNLIEQNHGYVLNGTNNVGELWGILRALIYIGRFSDRDMEAIIYSDSAYCIQGINTWRHEWKKNNWTRKTGELKNKFIWMSIDHYINKYPNIHFEKVKGHAGDKWNELADKLAKQGVEDGKNSIRSNEVSE